MLEGVLPEQTAAVSFLFASQLLRTDSHPSLAISGAPIAGKTITPTWDSETVTSVCLVNSNYTDSGSSCANIKRHMFVRSKSNKSQYIMQMNSNT
jgi:hypothetical protein